VPCFLIPCSLLMVTFFFWPLWHQSRPKLGSLKAGSVYLGPVELDVSCCSWQHLMPSQGCLSLPILPGLACPCTGLLKGNGGMVWSLCNGCETVSGGRNGPFCMVMAAL
jgi:hypothetical protein